MKFQYNDGGRSAAGYKGDAGDCVCRAICIATGKPYKEVYDYLANMNAGQRIAKREKKSKARLKVKTARHGIFTTRKWFKDYMESLGFEWVPAMQIGKGCTVHLEDGEIPMTGRLVVKVSKHLTAVIDGVIHDTYNPSENRGSTIYPPGYTKEELPKGAYQMDNGYWCYSPNRCVYGYYKLKSYTS